MNREELVNSLRYLIRKYAPEGKMPELELSLLLNDIPTKGILADLNHLLIRPMEGSDGALIRYIFFYFC